MMRCFHSWSRHQPVLIATLLSCLIALESAAFAQATRLVAFIAADTESQDIAADMKANIGAITFALKTNVAPEQLELRMIDGKNWSRRQTLREIDAAGIRADDAVLFFYSGHGYYSTTRGTFFTPVPDGGQRFYLSDIRQALQNTPARFRVCLLDCCSVIPNGNMAAPAPAPIVNPSGFTRRFESLFVEPTGEMIINSSKPGEYAVCRAHFSNGETRGGYTFGSLFTSILCGELSRSNEATTWEDLHQVLRHRVATDFKKFYPDGFIPLGQGRTIEQATQTVWGFRNGEQLE